MSSTERPWTSSALVRLGAYAWGLLGIVGAATLIALVLGQLGVVTVPLILALFPAALLSPLAEGLKRWRVPPSLASLLTIVLFVGVVAGGVTLLAPQVAAEIPGLIEEVEAGIGQVEDLFEDGLLGFEPTITPGEALELAQEQAVEFLQQQGVTIATAVAEGVAGLLFGAVGLFFYLKDGRRMAVWIRDQLPTSARATVHDLGNASWNTIGQYFRGQLLVALVDAIFIGIGLAILGVPLVLPLAVLVFLGGLFPIIGAVASGAVAVLVALASQGVAIAIATLALVVAVQQLESNVLAPIVLGRSLALHPLAIIVALSAGGILFGVLGAFLAVPVAASTVRAVGVLRRRLGAPLGTDEEPATAGTIQPAK
ncbi:AI-2E family transporter [Egibacter rhizosphaerae]|uniref:AI-2E family transporter n=1 Tax=Egibacter rhizosphaerae TaxID=1670831 RepID=A0A411YDZ3_9ACTN|nr:AI-2E family transporter [Egibacter rhizosphaerae]QBI19418.1 AI-2E family transporter [Egibacter rhizosphaerae]